MNRIEGTAIYRERIALPPSAIFEAVLEDVTKIYARPIEIARATVQSTSPPPIRFSIDYDPSQIDADRTYVVRAYIYLDGKILFASDTSSRVLTRGSGQSVELLLRMVPQDRTSIDPGNTVSGAHGLKLPATIRGDLPCADCEAIRHHLDLRPDHVFQLRREWVGRNFVRDEVGRWRVDPARGALALHGGGERPLQFEIMGEDPLRLLDIEGEPIVSDLPYEPISDGSLMPTDLSLPLAGEMIYMADAARFTECPTGRSYPVAMEGDFIAMERSYLENTSAPGAPLYVTFEGSIVDRPKMDGDGQEPTVVVTRFINAWPNERCERARASASLENTYWRIVRLGEQEVGVAEGRREPHLLLRGGSDEKRFSATLGCNQMVGGYRLEESGISFTAVASTMMACPPPLDDLERQLGNTLAKAKQWRIIGNTLELIDEADRPVALFVAVYF
ncbi:MAG TPA: YbaY family lipoprotein [Alphaproteobacteria bacterium]|nr:YbaY family lipoprotein [Alphaproteobacteria bacterium]